MSFFNCFNCCHDDDDEFDKLFNNQASRRSVGKKRADIIDPDSFEQEIQDPEMQSKIEQWKPALNDVPIRSFNHFMTVKLSRLGINLIGICTFTYKDNIKGWRNQLNPSKKKRKQFAKSFNEDLSQYKNITKPTGFLLLVENFLEPISGHSIAAYVDPNKKIITYCESLYGLKRKKGTYTFPETIKKVFRKNFIRYQEKEIQKEIELSGQEVCLYTAYYALHRIYEGKEKQISAKDMQKLFFAHAQEFKNHAKQKAKDVSMPPPATKVQI